MGGQGTVDFDDPFRPRFGRRRVVDRDRVPSPGGGFRRVQRKTMRPRLGRVAVKGPHASSRRCVIKASYVPIRTNGPDRERSG
jgi:hypothetical protein